MDPPHLQSSINLCNTTTPNKLHIEQIYPWQMDPPINHRSLLHHYTPISFTYSRMHIYPGQMDPLQLAIDLCYTITLYTDPPHPPIDHRSMLHHYTPISFTYRRMYIYPWQIDPPLQSTIDICYTITPNKCHM